MKRITRANLLSLRLQSLTDPIRLRLIRLVEREELSVGELAAVVQLPQSTVSRHLKVLAEAGWIVKRADGTATMYRLIMDDLEPEARSLWMTVRDQMGESTELAEDARRLASVVNDRKTDTQEFFGRVAGEWDGVRNDLFGDRVTLQALLPLIPAHWTVADLGCGTGNAAELLAPCVRRVIAVDQNDVMLAAAEKRLAQFQNIEFVQGDLEKLPIPDASVDAAVCVLVLHHMPDPQKACEQMARILRPGGVALIVDMVEHDRAVYRHQMGHRWMGFGVPAIIRMLTQAGLESPRVQLLPTESSAKGPGLFACTATKPGGTGTHPTA